MSARDCERRTTVKPIGSLGWEELNQMRELFGARSMCVKELLGRRSNFIFSVRAAGAGDDN